MGHGILGSARSLLICVLSVFLFQYGGAIKTVLAQQVQRAEISSPNPVGSGARALGMAGAFIASADDATAASWNPGALIQLERPEISAVGTFFQRTEDNSFGVSPDSSGPQKVSKAKLNYLSLSLPFVFLNRNMIISLNYQYLYDFSREWHIHFNTGFGASTDGEQYDYEQIGSLSAIGVAYCVQILPQLSFGFSLNFWRDLIYENGWNQTVSQKGSGRLSTGPGDPGILFHYVSTNIDQYRFRGFNANVGFLWHITNNLTIGTVIKTPFTAILEHKNTDMTAQIYPGFPAQSYAYIKTTQEEARMRMPLSYGMGLCYRYSDSLSLAADIYRIEWQRYVIRDMEGNEISPISGLPIEQSRVDPVFQARIGAEYLIILSKLIIALRAGIFLDQAPAVKTPEDYYGCAVGTGVAVGPVAFDIAYQFRFGDSVGTSILERYDFSQQVIEHTLYSSLIVQF